MATENQHLMSFSIFSCIINVDIKSSYLRSLLRDIYGSMEVDVTTNKADLQYIIREEDAEIRQMVISRAGCADLITDDIGEFLFFFEKDMTIELQKIRSDLLFIHSAALEYQGQGLLLVAPSGTGKSTTSWAMLNSGFNYLSDELAPLDLNSMQVLPYPHALCLKAIPPLYELPDDCVDTGSTIHVPGAFLADKISLVPVKLNYVFYLEFDANIIEPEINEMSAAEASAKLYANSLNILAHDTGEKGIQAAVSVAKRVKNYSLKSNHLDKTCERLKSLMAAS